MNIIEGKLRTGKRVWIWLEAITAIEEEEGCTLVIAGGKIHYLSDTPEEILKTITRLVNI